MSFQSSAAVARWGRRSQHSHSHAHCLWNINEVFASNYSVTLQQSCNCQYIQDERAWLCFVVGGPPSVEQSTQPTSFVQDYYVLNNISTVKTLLSIIIVYKSKRKTKLVFCFTHSSWQFDINIFSPPRFIIIIFHTKNFASSFLFTAWKNELILLFLLSVTKYMCFMLTLSLSKSYAIFLNKHTSSIL